MIYAKSFRDIKQKNKADSLPGWKQKELTLLKAEATESGEFEKRA